MTDSAPSRGLSSTAAQRAAVLAGTIVLLTLGAALALGTGPRDARPRSALASISSERALDARAQSAAPQRRRSLWTTSSRPRLNGTQGERRRRRAARQEAGAGSTKKAPRRRARNHQTAHSR
jgi:hypothetical protein